MDNKLRIILSICPGDFEGSEEFYLKRMTEFRSNYSQEFLTEFEHEFLKLSKDTNYSFKLTCKELSFFAYDEKESEQDLRNYLTNFFSESKYIANVNKP